MPLTADLRPVDHARAARLVLAYATGSRAAFDLALAETDNEPGGLPGLLFALTEYTASLVVAVAPDDYVAQIQQVIAQNLFAGEPGHGE